MIKKWLGKGILGIGQRRGLFIFGEILVLVYDPKEDAAIIVESMRGFSIFVRFKEKTEYAGLSLAELRRRGLEADRQDFKLWRIFFHYTLHKTTKRKGAMIQAVEAVEKYLARKTFEPLIKITDSLSRDNPETTETAQPPVILPSGGDAAERGSFFSENENV